jgi:hypothetical protein
VCCHQPGDTRAQRPARLWHKLSAVRRKWRMASSEHGVQVTSICSRLWLAAIGSA